VIRLVLMIASILNIVPSFFLLEFLLHSVYPPATLAP
jgi:hypothetical protein